MTKSGGIAFSESLYLSPFNKDRNISLQWQQVSPVLSFNIIPTWRGHIVAEERVHSLLICSLSVPEPFYLAPILSSHCFPFWWNDGCQSTSWILQSTDYIASFPETRQENQSINMEWVHWWSLRVLDIYKRRIMYDNIRPFFSTVDFKWRAGSLKGLLMKTPCNIVLTHLLSTNYDTQ